ncbi:MFS transporter [Curtobacterium sp. MCBD17_019]|uniref:MFS transporter n=1 Tax=Curtobacterium sp. MCBD17_019 TaxID=2175669 RepID=UPI000DA8E4B6|nr:MFS transporter [Curtobacterium sp. MCBD17_019]PZE77037.1 MFS transporter [Curtobacterium sp. MCBD17_019]
MLHRSTSPSRVLRPGLVLVGLLLVAANLRAGITSVGPVLADVQQSVHLPSATASALISLPLLAFAAVAPVAPAIARALGIERTLGVSLAALAVGIVLRSVPGPALLWVGTVLLGVAIAVVNVELPALVKRDFPDRIGQVTGAYSAVQSTFAAIAAGIAVPVAGSDGSGWRLALGLWAGLALVALAVFAPQLRARTVLPPAADDVALDDVRHPDPTHRSPWRSALGWQVTAFMGLQSVGYYVVITWLPTIERTAGVSAAAAGAHQFLLNAFAIAGSLLCSAALPRFRDQRILASVSPLFFVAAMAGQLLDPHLAAVWDSLIGVSGGACIVLALSFFGLRTEHHRQAAGLSAMAQTVGYLLAAAGPIAVSALHDAVGSWRPALVVLLVLEVALAGLGLLAGRRRVIG